MAGVFVHQQVRQMKELGCEILVVSPVPYVPKALSARSRYHGLPDGTTMDGVPVVYPRYFRLPGRRFHAPSSYTLYLAVHKAIRQEIERFQPQLVHTHTATPDGYAGLLLGRKVGLPIVVSLHGSDINVYPFRDHWTRRLTERVLAESDAVVAVSHALKEAAEALASPRKEIVVAHTGCDLARFRFDPKVRDTIRDSLRIPRASIVMVFVGHVVRTKGVDELIQAFLEVEGAVGNLHLIVVGAGEHARGLKARAEREKSDNRVHVVGRRPHREIPGWLSAGDMLVLPSWHEGLPNVVIEAMACERPVVATRVGGIPEAVKDGESGILIEKGDAGGLAGAIALLARDPARRASMGTAGRRIVERGFSWEANAKRTMEVYKGVLDGR
jgi:teichuronic acid biosynthesis glycosyltransferase TuaC